MPAYTCRSSTLIERALSQFDIMVDYAAVTSSVEEKSSRLQRRSTFFDHKKCEDRAVTAIDWSPHNKELFLVAYARKQVGNLHPPVNRRLYSGGWRG